MFDQQTLAKYLNKNNPTHLTKDDIDELRTLADPANAWAGCSFAEVAANTRKAAASMAECTRLRKYMKAVLDGQKLPPHALSSLGLSPYWRLVLEIMEESDATTLRSIWYLNAII